MKKFCTALAIFALVLAGCKQPTTEDNSSKLPNLTIRNESSFVLTNVTFSGISFSASGGDLPVSGQSLKQLTANDINKAGYITFTRKDIGIACRTQAISIGNEDYTFTFIDATVVEELANSSNKNTLAQISYLSRVAVERGGLTVAKNDTENLGETVVDTLKQTEFTLKNTGVGKLLLTGTEPVKITGAGSDAFSAVQPVSSEIAPNGSLTFTINFAPSAIQDYNAAVTISSNDQDGDFTFSIRARSAAPKPIATVYYGDSEIAQNGTIDAGEVFITLSETIAVIIKNTGTEVLTLDTANITITGTDAETFIKSTSLGGSISAGGQTSFVIECKPTKQGENYAILVIPTNDSSRNPITVYLKVTGVKGSAIPQLRQRSTIIQNNSLTPVDFGQINVGANTSLVFAIKNIGTIALNLTGTPVIESSNSVFTVTAQPAASIAPNTEVLFNLRYTPTAEGEDTAAITFLNNSDALEFSFTVKGTGHIPKPQITVKQGNTVIDQHGEYDFGAILKGNTREITFTIGNSGDANLTFITVGGNRVNLADNSAGLFSIVSQPSATVTPGGTTTFTIKFNPTAIGNNFFAEVRINTNSRDNSDFSFRVRGTGRGYLIGEVGPGGGLVFYAVGNQFKESSDCLGQGSWNTAVTYTGTVYRGGGYSDWYLPEIWELKLIYQNLYKNNLGDFYDDDEFWSSTTVGDTGAMILDFWDGVEYPDYRTRADVLVIAVRSFTL